MDMKSQVVERFNREFGNVSRSTMKVKAWKIRDDFGIVVQIDSPIRDQAAFVWLPYPPEF
jgi:hypothetical protein